MMRVLAAVIAVGLCANLATGQPRALDDRITDLAQVMAVKRAVMERINVDDDATREAQFPGSSFTSFDRNRDGAFYTSGNAWGLYDYGIVITQYLHDTTDLDEDGVPGFVELECERAGGSALDPNLSQTTPGTPDGQVDCDGDGLSNAAEIALGFNPLNGDDAALDSDHDGISDAMEAMNGTRATPVLFLVNGQDVDADHVTIEVMLDQDDVDLQPLLAEFFINFDPAALEYVSTTGGDALRTAGGKLAFGALENDNPNSLRATITSTNFEKIRSGQLLLIRFRRVAEGPYSFTFNTDSTRLSPVAARNVQTFGVGHPEEPMVIGGEL